MRKGPSGCGSARPVADGPETMVLYGSVVVERPVRLRTGPSGCGWTLSDRLAQPAQHQPARPARPAHLRGRLDNVHDRNTHTHRHIYAQLQPHDQTTIHNHTITHTPHAHTYTHSFKALSVITAYGRHGAPVTNRSFALKRCASSQSPSPQHVID